MNKLIEAIEAAQAVLGRTLLPGTSSETDSEAIGELLGILDSRDFVTHLQELKARNQVEIGPIELTACDTCTADVINQLANRAEVGLRKYGTTVGRRTDLSPKDWLQHLQEELLDAAVYVEKLKKDA